MKYKNIITSISFFCLILFSCKKGEKGPDLAIQISGDYVLYKYMSQEGKSYIGSKNLISIEKRDNNHAKLIINYLYVADSGAVNVVIPNMLVQKIDNKYELSQVFSDSKAFALVKDSVLILKINYLNGDFLEAFAKKQ